MKKIIFLLFLNLVAEIQSALVLVNEEVKQNTNLTLNNALLTINTEIGENQDGGVDLWVLSGQVSSENRSSDKVIIRLVPDPDGPAELTFKSTEEMLSERLAKSIIDC